MDKKEVIVALITAHRKREPGKISPDKELKEYQYSRELCLDLKAILEAYGITSYIDMLATDLDKTCQSPSVRLERQRELALRCNIVNQICKENPSKQVIAISPHLNASGNDNEWHDPSGWQVVVGTKASEKSKIIANCFYDAASANEMKMRQPSKEQKYWVQDLYVMNNITCPAVLTENLFMDNLQDKSFLLSEEGRHTIERIHVEGILKAIETL